MKVYVLFLTGGEMFLLLLLVAMLLLLVTANLLLGNFFIAALLGEAGIFGIAVFLLRLCFSTTIKEVNCK